MRYGGWLSLLLGPGLALAQGGMSQARMEEDCLQRLQPLIAQGVTVQGVNFAALGHNATYYVVSYRFSRELPSGQRTAACTYWRDGQWARDDATAYRMARELDAGRAR